MFKLIKLAPVLWMAFRWFKSQKNGTAYKTSRYSGKDRRF